MTQFETVWEATEETEHFWSSKEPGEDISYTNLSPTKSTYFCHPVVISKYLSFSDYDNSCHVERSNNRVFMAAFGDVDGVFEVYGGYGSQGVVIRADVDNQEIIECLCALTDYPVIDDDDCSEMEMELQEESWDNCYYSEFCDILQGFFDIDDLSEVLTADQIYELFRYGQEKSNTYWEIESGGNAYIDIKRVADVITMDDVNDVIEGKELKPW